MEKKIVLKTSKSDETHVPDTSGHTCHNTSSRTRNFLVTIMNPSEAEKKVFKRIEPQLNMKKTRWQIEKAPTTGTIHIQASLIFNNAKYINQVKKLFPRANIQAVKMKWLDEKRITNYCSKKETRIEDPFNWSGIEKYDGPSAPSNPKYASKEWIKYCEDEFDKELDTSDFYEFLETLKHKKF